MLDVDYWIFENNIVTTFNQDLTGGQKQTYPPLVKSAALLISINLNGYTKVAKIFLHLG